MNGNGFRHPQKRAFLAAYRQTGNIRAATEAAGVDRTTFYKWTENDLVFAAAAQQAKEEFGDMLEAKLSQMALKHDNVTALIVALKMAGRFREVTRNEISGTGDPITIRVQYADLDPAAPALGPAHDSERSPALQRSLAGA